MRSNIMTTTPSATKKYRRKIATTAGLLITFPASPIRTMMSAMRTEETDVTVSRGRSGLFIFKTRQAIAKADMTERKAYRKRWIYV